MVIFWKSHRRRPVRVGRCRGAFDPQTAIPAGWCVCCGREVFLPGEDRCPDCMRKER